MDPDQIAQMENEPNDKKNAIMIAIRGEQGKEEEKGETFACPKCGAKLMCCPAEEEMAE